MADDPYVYPGTQVLRNELGIRDADQLERVEADLTAWRAARLAAHPIPGSYDLAHLQAIHRHLFGGLYPWAGELRTVTIAKPGSLFALPQHLESYAGDVFARLAREQHLRGLGRDAFIDRLTVYYADVNAMHPFREGNGRAQRAFFSQLASDAGHQLRWDRLDPARNIAAAQAAMRGDNAPLRALLDAATATERGPPDVAELQRLSRANFPSPPQPSAPPRAPGAAPRRRPPPERGPDRSR